MRDITALFNTPLNRLFFAINHFISTGDHIGEGISMPEGSAKKAGEPDPTDKVRIMVLVNTTLKDDLQDFEKFKARFNQIADRFNTKLEYMGQQAHFRVNSFVIQYSQADELAQVLTEEPGPKGWGSMKELIEKHFPG